MRGGVGLWWRCCLEGEWSCSFSRCEWKYRSTDCLSEQTQCLDRHESELSRLIERHLLFYLSCYTMSHVTSIRRHKRFDMYNKLLDGEVQLIPHLYRKIYQHMYRLSKAILPIDKSDERCTKSPCITLLIVISSSASSYPHLCSYIVANIDKNST